MALTLAQLLAAQTTDQWRAVLLNSLQGLGVVTASNAANAGSVISGTGVLTLSGIPTNTYKLVIKIVTSGELGTAAFQYSTDGGTSYSGNVTVPGGATYAVPSTGVTVTFAAGPSGAGTSFISGDLYSATLSAPNFPATSWAAGSVPRDLVETDAQAFAEADVLTAAISAGGLLTQASGAWLDQLGTNVYNLTRNPAIALVGQVTLTDSGNAGPFTITAGQLWFSAGLGSPYRFNNTAGGTLSHGGTLTLAVQAEAPGAAYNVGIGAVTTMATPLPGVTVNNPDLGTGLWYTTAGVDQESDSAFITRCQGKWSTLGTGATLATYDYWARTAVAAVTRTIVQADPTTPGQVDMYLAGPSGPSSGGDVATVLAYVLARVPLTVTPVVLAAITHAITVTGSVIYDTTKTSSSAVQTAINTAFAAYALTIPLGKSPTGTVKVYLAKLSAIIEDLVGVLSVTLSVPAADVSLAFGEVATLSTASFAGWTFTAG